MITATSAVSFVQFLSNMKMSITKNIFKATLVSAMLLAFSGCDDNIDPEIEEINVSRVFSPTGVTAQIKDIKFIELDWNLRDDATEYIVEFSQDSLEFATIIRTLTVSPNDLPVREEFEGDTRYSVRVKAVNDAGKDDSKWAAVTVKTEQEQIFSPISEADLSYNLVTLHWAEGGSVTHITITPEDGETESYEISEDEMVDRTKTITGLIPGTEYTVVIYNGEARRGNRTFTTLSLDVPDAEQVIYLNATDVFSQNTFDTLTTSSVVFVMPQGAVYSAAAALILKGEMDINFYGAPGANKAIIAFNGFTLPAIGGRIKFENVDLTGYDYVDGVETSTKRNYIFNQSVASQTEEIVFENCVVRNFTNTPFRIQSSNAINVGKLVFNNCVVRDIGNNGTTGTYAFIHTNVATGSVSNIEITNSTLYDIGYSIILHSAAPSTSVKIENCTFNDVVGNGRYLVDYNAQLVTDFSFVNNVIGKSKSPANTSRGIRINALAVTVANSNYITNDFVMADFIIGGASSYSGASTDLFVDPANGNFGYKDLNYAGKSTTGDPRWRQ